MCVLLRLSPLLSTLVLIGSAEAQVAGTVVDSTTDAPLEGARVSVQATGIETLSAAGGAFVLPSGLPESLVVVGAMKGYYNAGRAVSSTTTDVVIRLDPVPHRVDPNWTFDSPAQCASRCHPNQLRDWESSAMSRAGLNTWVYDIYDGSGTATGTSGFVYVRDSVHAGDAPESECKSCHQPEPWLDEPFTALGDLANVTDGMRHGVSCQVCHLIAHVDPTKPNFPGLYPGTVEVTRLSTGAVQYGLLGDVTFDFEPRNMRASYQPQLGAAVCGTCHQDKNDPDGDGDFEEDNGVISEPTYLEWLNSEYSDPSSPRYANCVTCHMPPTNDPDACSQNSPSIARPDGDVRSHRFEGTSDAFLTNAVTMSVDARRVPGTLSVRVAIANDQTGHHVPTGVTIRNMILLVEAERVDTGDPLTFTSTQTVHDLGGIGDPSQGDYAGLPGKLYAKVNHAANGQGPTFFTDATGILFDSRIPALETDVTHYAFLVPTDADVRVRARLIYRRSWRALALQKGWVEDGYGNPLRDVLPPHYGALMESFEQVVSAPVEPPDGGVETDASLADSGVPNRDSGVADVGAGEEDSGCGCHAAFARRPRSPLGVLGPLGCLGLLIVLRRGRRAFRR